ncbi:MAG: tetratricopeptide repeat protein [Chlamydiota bacterium]
MVVDIMQTPTEIFNIIDDFAGTLGFLPSISQLLIQKSPLLNKRAEIIANLGRDKIAEFYSASQQTASELYSLSILPLLELAKVYDSLAEKEQTMAIADFAKEKIEELHDSYTATTETQAKNVFPFLELAEIYNSLGDANEALALQKEGELTLKDCRELLQVLKQKLDRKMSKILIGSLNKHGTLDDSFFEKTLKATFYLFKIIEIHFSLNELDEAQRFLQQLEDLACKMPNVFNNACKTLIKIASVHLKMGNIEKAEEFLHIASKTADVSDDWVAESFKDLAILYLKMGDIEKTEELLEKSVEKRFALPVVFRADLLIELSLAYAEIDKTDKAVSLLRKAERYSRRSELKEKNFPAIASVYIKIKNLNEAERLLNLLATVWHNDDAVLALANAYYAANDVDAARRVANMIFSFELKEKAFAKFN